MTLSAQSNSASKLELMITLLQLMNSNTHTWTANTNARWPGLFERSAWWRR